MNEYGGPYKVNGRGVTLAEFKTAEDFREKGWEVLRGGWPDFLMVKDNEVKFVEVKSYGDMVRPEQARLHEALKLAGIKVEIVWRRAGDGELDPPRKKPATQSTYKEFSKRGGI